MWSRHCPENYRHKLFLASAEIHRIENLPEKAALLYDMAIEAAHENDFIQWEAMANERACLFWTDRGNGRLAQIYWQRAYTCYHAWGAKTKLRFMEARFKREYYKWHGTDAELFSGNVSLSTSCNRHIDCFRKASEMARELEKKASASQVADELAEAIKHLRIESAQRRQAEGALQKALSINKKYIKELEGKNAELDEFTYIASHDLQEPLRKIASFSKLLERDVGQDLNETAQKDMAYIIDGVRRMEILIQDLLQLSRAGRGVLSFEKISLNHCVEEVENLLQGPFGEKGAKLIKQDLPEVIGDKTLITLLFQNLIQNALKFSDKEAPLVEITLKEESGRRVFGVKDNGIGIQEKYREMIFHPFKRLHGRQEYPGTGIGLAICKKVIDRHHGEFWVDSVVGAYAHFQFTLDACMETLDDVQG